MPLGVFVHEISFFVQNVGSVGGGAVRFRVWIFQSLNFFDIVHGRSKIAVSVRKGAMGAIFNTETSSVRVVHAHAGLVISQVIAALGVPGGAM